MPCPGLAHQTDRHTRPGKPHRSGTLAGVADSTVTASHRSRHLLSGALFAPERLCDHGRQPYPTAAGHLLSDLGIKHLQVHFTLTAGQHRGSLAHHFHQFIDQQPFELPGGLRERLAVLAILGNRKLSRRQLECGHMGRKQVPVHGHHCTSNSACNAPAARKA